MTILLITPYFPPDRNQAAMMYSGLAADLATRGHHVLVVTGQPHYAAEAKRGPWRLYSTERGGNTAIVRIFVPRLKRQSLFNRLLVLAFFNLLGSLYLLLAPRADVALITSPAIEECLMIYIAHWKRIPYHFRIHDLYPEIAIRLGVFRPGAASSAVIGWVENKAIEWARTVSVVTNAFKQYFGRAGIPASKIAVVPDWVDTSHIFPSSRNNAFSREHGLDGKFVVMYGGNIGLSQNLEILVEAARLLKDQNNIVILIIGEGAAKARLLELNTAYQLKNVIFLPFQAPDSLNDVYAACDVGLVSLAPSVSPEWCPAKIYTILASGKPVLAAVDDCGEAARLLEDNRCGVCVAPGSPRALADAILGLARNREELAGMGMRGRALVAEKYSRSVCTARLGGLLEGLVSQ
jgi:colanic acid biosynthesis glycosyl transferase WcaI